MAITGLIFYIFFLESRVNTMSGTALKCSNVDASGQTIFFAPHWLFCKMCHLLPAMGPYLFQPLRALNVLTLCMLLFLSQRNASLPDENNVVRLQEELIGAKLREAEALTGLKELRQQVRDLEEHWQVDTV